MPFCLCKMPLALWRGSRKNTEVSEFFFLLNSLALFLFPLLLFVLLICVYFLRAELKKKFSEDIKSLKSEVRAERNQADEVTECVEEDLARARLLRHGVDQDLMQAKTTIEDHSSRLKVSEDRWTGLWSSFQTMASLLRTLEDDGVTWGQFIPLIPARLQGFVKKAVRASARNILVHIWVLAPTVSLEKLTEEAENQEYLDAVERMEPQVNALATELAD